MRGPRVRLSPQGMVAVEVTPAVWIELHRSGARVDQLRYLDPGEVTDWAEYGPPT